MASTPGPMSRRASTNDLYSPPPSIARRASSVASHGTSPQLGSERKKRTRNLLRDYYGLADANKKAGDPMDIDSPNTFNPDVYFASLSTTSSLPDLLKRENELLTEIRELDGERQSLVYNHHHELIEASDTIRKMKSRAEALDTSLDSLKASFQSISQLSASLAPSTSSPTTVTTTSRSAPSQPPAATPSTPTRRRLSALVEDPPTPTPGSATASELTAPPPKTVFDPLVHLPALLSLPVLLR
ncbi:Vps51/Vps67-domain-containing protein, partial [Leucosporidium creatinivorum]